MSNKDAVNAASFFLPGMAGELYGKAPLWFVYDGSRVMEMFLEGTSPAVVM